MADRRYLVFAVEDGHIVQKSDGSFDKTIDNLRHFVTNQLPAIALWMDDCNRSDHLIVDDFLILCVNGRKRIARGKIKALLGMIGGAK